MWLNIAVFYRPRDTFTLPKCGVKQKRVCTSSPPDYLSKHVAFYLDGISFIFKGNPMSGAESQKEEYGKRSGRRQKTASDSGSIVWQGVIFAEPYEKRP